MVGRSLLPVLRGDADPHQIRSAVRSEYYDALDEPDGTLATMYRDERYKISVYHGVDVGELYDMEADRTELNDLAADYPYLVRGLAEKYEEWAERCSVMPWDTGWHAVVVRNGPIDYAIIAISRR